MKSIFTDKAITPDDGALKKALGKTYALWHAIVDYAHAKYPKAFDEWSYGGEKAGWIFRTKDKKRAIVYLLPRDGFFKVAFVFGQKATNEVMDSPIADTIKNELEAAKPYAEGRGIRIEIKDESLMNDIKQLIDIKLNN